MSDFSISSRHRLQEAGRDVRFEAPRVVEGAPMPTRRFLVMHFTAGWSLESTIARWRHSGARGACAHLIIDRDGTVVQCRPFNETAAHCGTSAWMDRKTGTMHRNLNHCTIGIELCNVGVLPRTHYPMAMGRPLGGISIPFIERPHKHGGRRRKWETFPTVQVDTARAVAAVLVARYQLDDVVGHDDIAPDRKEDPGPAFPMGDFRSRLGFTAAL